MRLFPICLLFAAAAAAAETSWPQFRGPSADGLGAGSPPTEWNVGSGKTILWKTEIPGFGHIRDSKSAIAWSGPKGGNYMQTPLLTGGLGYFCFDSGVLSVYRMATGERQYHRRLGGGPPGFTSSAVAAGGHLNITNEEGHSYVLAFGPEYKLLAGNDLGETVMATPAIADGALYMRGGKHLVAIGARQ